MCLRTAEVFLKVRPQLGHEGEDMAGGRVVVGHEFFFGNFLFNSSIHHDVPVHQHTVSCPLHRAHE